MGNKLFNVVDAGEKSKEEIKEMIANIKEGEILSIQFSPDADENVAGEEWQYRCD